MEVIDVMFFVCFLLVVGPNRKLYFDVVLLVLPKASQSVPFVPTHPPTLLMCFFYLCGCHSPPPLHFRASSFENDIVSPAVNEPRGGHTQIAEPPSGAAVRFWVLLWALVRAIWG